jgi:hypothetical protein
MSPIALAKTLKTSWKVTAGSSGSHDLLMVKCRPRLDNPDGKISFGISYLRYSVEGKEWVLRERNAPGFWEDEGEFPNESLFPGGS